MEVKNGSTFIARYGYDGAGRRITKLIGKEFRHYYYSDQWQILEERLLDNPYADRRFIWGLRYIDDLVCRDRLVGGRTERLYALNDQVSGTAVVDVNGTVVERYGYDAFGTPRYMNASFGARSSSDYEWETLFSSYRYDLETGFYQVRNRYHHPKLGTWLSRDPIGYWGGTNLYANCLNCPVSTADPAGLDFTLTTNLNLAISAGYRYASPGAFNKIRDSLIYAGSTRDPGEGQGGIVAEVYKAPDNLLPYTIGGDELKKALALTSGGLVGLGGELWLTGKLREEYVDRAAQLSPADKAARDALRAEFQERQTSLGKAITGSILKEREASGHSPSLSDATKTDPNVNATAKAMKFGGTALAAASAAMEVYSVVAAPQGQRIEAAGQSVGRLGGAAMLGEAGAEFGALGGPWGAAAGAFIGGAVGAVLGEGLANSIIDSTRSSGRFSSGGGSFGGRGAGSFW